MPSSSLPHPPSMARSAAATLDWLEAHGYQGLVRESVVVISRRHVRRGAAIDVNALTDHSPGPGAGGSGDPV